VGSFWKVGNLSGRPVWTSRPPASALASLGEARTAYRCTAIQLAPVSCLASSNSPLTVVGAMRVALRSTVIITARYENGHPIAITTPPGLPNQSMRYLHPSQCRS